jgi:hypothetical protein
VLPLIRIGAGPTLPVSARRSMTAVGRMARSRRSHLYAWIPRKTGGSRASVLSDKRDLALGFFRRPAIRLGAGAAHQHRPLGVAEAVSLQEGLDAPARS